MTGKDKHGHGDTGGRALTNLTASINQRLLNLARQRREEFQSVLTRYALERLLYRLGASPYSDQFILKGALVFSLWQGDPHRATHDLDLLGFGPNDIERLQEVFRSLCRLPILEDGLQFIEDAVHGAPIREDQQYGGIRIRLLGMLGKARIPLQVDIGFGDVVTPTPVAATYPTLLDLPAPQIRTYPRETVAAEKFEAMIRLGMANTRMKDFYDLWTLAQRFAFEGMILSHALAATFSRRSTPLPPGTPLALLPEFREDRGKQVQWSAFLRKGRLEPANLTLRDVAEVLSTFLLPPAHAAAREAAFDARWGPGGPWRSLDDEQEMASSGV